MDPVDRLASYLADELAPDERAALDAELARDAQLRAQLDALRRADAALSGMRSPDPPDGFDARLDARLDAELAELLGRADAATDRAAATAAPAAEVPSAVPAGDEPAARHRARPVPRWVVAVSGAAAGLAVLGVGGVVITSLLQGTEDAAVTALDAPAGDARTADELAELEMDDAEAFGIPAGPTIAALDRDLQGDEVTGLLDDPVAFALAATALAPDDAVRVRTSYLAQLPLPEVAAEDAHETLDVPDSQADTPPAELQRLGDVDGSLLADVGACLEVVLADSPTAVPTYAEALTLDGEAVIALGLVSEDPATGAFTRRELWVFSRDGCEVRSFSQR